MKVSIGILAWNEQAAIGRTIDSIFGQSIFQGGHAGLESIEVVCVPNGCTDATADLARRAFEQAALKVTGVNVSWRVVELTRPGKANAWNEYVHAHSDPSTDYIMLMDADVQMPQADTLQRLISTLEATPGAVIATARPVKDIALKARKGFTERMSVGLSDFVQAKGGAIAGALYCGRAAFLRQAWLPLGVVGDDSFLKLLVITDLFRSKGHKDRILRAPDTTVVFEPPRGMKNILHHQRRSKVAHGINMILYEYLWANSTPEGAGVMIQRLNTEEPGWVGRVIEQRVKGGGWWLMPKGVVRSRFRQLRGLSWPRKLFSLPTISAAAAVDAAMLFAANKVIRRGTLTGIWRREEKR